MGENYALGFGRLIAANRPRYGGYIVHLAVVLLALGVTGSSFYAEQMDVILAPGERASIGDYQIEYLSTMTTQRPDRVEFVTNINAYKDGRFLEAMAPERTFYPDFSMASTRAAIRSTAVEDLYIIPSEGLEDGRAGFRIYVNPLVWWMWIAGPVFILGTLIALWPQRGPAPATMRAQEPRGTVRAYAAAELPEQAGTD